MADYHQDVLTRHCRVCAKPLAKFKVSYSCEERADELEKTFRIVVSMDSPDVHPTSFCHSCYNVLVRSRKAREANRMYTPLVQQFSWNPHTDHSCTVCDHFVKASGGGRPRKQKIGRPSTDSTRSAIMHLHSIAPPSFFSSVDVHSLTIQSSTTSVSTDDLVCQLCSTILDRPIQLTACNSLVCLKCLCESLGEREFRCPCCNSNPMVHPSPVIMKIPGVLYQL